MVGIELNNVPGTCKCTRLSLQLHNSRQRWGKVAAWREEGNENGEKMAFRAKRGGRGMERETGNMIKLRQALSARLFSVQLGCWLAPLV